MHAFPEGHVVSVRSTPAVMASAIAVIASPVMYSSTKKKPAMSPFQEYDVDAVHVLPKYTYVVKSGMGSFVDPPQIGKLLS